LTPGIIVEAKPGFGMIVAAGIASVDTPSDSIMLASPAGPIGPAGPWGPVSPLSPFSPFSPATSPVVLKTNCLGVSLVSPERHLTRFVIVFFLVLTQTIESAACAVVVIETSSAAVQENAIRIELIIINSRNNEMG
jgi:hypothetical protein